jgi:hypothetical protein
MSIGPSAEAAFSDFVARDYRGLVRTAYLLTADRHQAEDPGWWFAPEKAPTALAGLRAEPDF